MHLIKCIGNSKFKENFSFYRLRITFLSSLLLIVSCSSIYVDNSKLRKSIVSANKKIMEYMNNGNSSDLVSMYTSNGQLFPTNSRKITGREKIQSFWQKYIDEGAQIKLKTLEVEGIGNTAYEVGEYLLFTGNFNKGDKGDFQLKAWCKYIVIWKKEDGQLKQHRNIWNTTPTISAKAD